MGPHHSSLLSSFGVDAGATLISRLMSPENANATLHRWAWGCTDFQKADFDDDAVLYIIVPKPSMKRIPASNAMVHCKLLTGQQTWGLMLCRSLKCGVCQACALGILADLPFGSLIRGNLTARGLGLNAGLGGRVAILKTPHSAKLPSIAMEVSSLKSSRSSLRNMFSAGINRAKKYIRK
jgi:hypothetical protein